MVKILKRLFEKITSEQQQLCIDEIRNIFKHCPAIEYKEKSVIYQIVGRKDVIVLKRKIYTAQNKFYFDILYAVWRTKDGMQYTKIIDSLNKKDEIDEVFWTLSEWHLFVKYRGKNAKNGLGWGGTKKIRIQQ